MIFFVASVFCYASKNAKYKEKYFISKGFAAKMDEGKKNIFLIMVKETAIFKTIF